MLLTSNELWIGFQPFHKIRKIHSVEMKTTIVKCRQYVRRCRRRKSRLISASHRFVFWRNSISGSVNIIVRIAIKRIFFKSKINGRINVSWTRIPAPTQIERTTQFLKYSLAMANAQGQTNFSNKNSYRERQKYDNISIQRQLKRKRYMRSRREPQNVNGLGHWAG